MKFFLSLKICVFITIGITGYTPLTAKKIPEKVRQLQRVYKQYKKFLKIIASAIDALPAEDRFEFSIALTNIQTWNDNDIEACTEKWINAESSYSQLEVYQAVRMFFGKLYEITDCKTALYFQEGMAFRENGSSIYEMSWIDWLYESTTIKPYVFTESEATQALIKLCTLYASPNDNNFTHILQEWITFLSNPSEHEDAITIWKSCLQQSRYIFNPVSAQLTAFLAFQTMHLFLEDFVFTNKNEGVKKVYSDLYIKPDGYTNDPYAWGNWLACVRHVVATTPTCAHEVTTEAKDVVLSPLEAFRAMIHFLKLTNKNTPSPELEVFISKISALQEAPASIEIFSKWSDCVMRIILGNNDQ